MNKTVKIFIGISIVVIIFVGVFPYLRKSEEPLDSDQQNATNEIKKDVTVHKEDNLDFKKTQNDNEVVYKNYVNQDFNIKLSYPENYELLKGVMGTVVVFLKEKEDPTNLFQENLNVMVQDLSNQPMTLEEYNSLSLREIGSFITDAKILSSDKTILAGKPAYEVVYTGKQGAYTFKWKQKWTIIDNIAYVLSYTSEINQFDNSLKAFDKIFDSFEKLN